MNYSTWMAQLYNVNTGAQNTLLQNICFPATHDSGTYALQNELTDDNEPTMGAIVNFVDQVVTKLQEVPFINIAIADPAIWVCDTIYDATRGIAQATTQTVAEQLNAGIRSLDFRIKYNSSDGNYYTYHGLLGSNMTEILGDIQAFLQSTTGEIVVVNVSHFLDFTDDAQYVGFTNLLQNYLGNNALQCQMDEAGNVINNFFNQTYSQVTTQNNNGQSTVIIAFQADGYTPPVTATSIFWPAEYCSPEVGGYGGPLTGWYSNTDDFSDLVSTQQQIQQGAGTTPFALYMTLTAQPSDAVAIIAGALALPLAAIAIDYSALPGLPEAIASISEFLAVVEISLPWTTLEQLSAPVQSQLYPLVVNNFIAKGSTSNTIAYLYCDFYENTSLVDLCIAMNTGNSFGLQYLTMFSMNSNTYITQQLFAGGQMGGQVYSAGWENRYASLLPFQAGGVNYLYGFAPNADPDNFWFIQELMADGSMGASQTASGNFHNNYAIQTTYTVNGNTFLFGMNADDNYQFTQQLLPGGTMAANQAQGDQWDNGPYWTVVTYADANGSTYMFGYNPSSGYWFMQEVYDDGTMAANETASGTMDGGPYTSAVTFNVNGESYIFCFSAEDNSWFIQQLSGGTFVGNRTDQGTWANAYSSFVTYEANGEVFLFGFCQDNNYWFIQQIMPGGTFAPNQSSGGYWGNPYGCFGVYNPNIGQSSVQAKRASLEVPDEVQ